jgi:hypothetical protein
MAVLAGVIISCALTAFVWLSKLAFYLPLFWPGMFFTWGIMIVFHGATWDNSFSLMLTTIGNSIFYAWASFQVIKAELLWRKSQAEPKP